MVSLTEIGRKPFILALAVALIAIVFISFDGLEFAVNSWSREEYSHGFLIPFVACFLLIQQLPRLESFNTRGSWLGLAVVSFGVFLVALGELGTVYTLIQYGFLLLVYGLVLALAGVRGFMVFWGGLVYLIFMIPLPQFFYHNLSSELQLVSSSLGVAVIRLFDISVFLEGNIIDLGAYKLQVVEACSGLNYLFPLMSFGFLLGYLYRGAIWQRWVIFLSSIPITIFMNSFRIGVIGVLVEHWGIGMADGFLHYFEGWIIFMACTALLLLEIWCFHRLSKTPGSFLSQLNLSAPSLSMSQFGNENWTLRKHKPFVASVAILLTAIPFSYALEDRAESIPDRYEFVRFPLLHQGWIGREESIDTPTLETLALTDYAIANYTLVATQGDVPEEELPVNFYVAYYDSQRKGASIHSPRSCIPGGGWRITEHEIIPVELYQSPSDSNVLHANRVIIQRGDNRQLVYYWFDQRGRNITNEYLAKWYIFWDSLTINRSDGALVRLVVPIPDGMSEVSAENHLQEFLRDFNPLLSDYIPR